MGALVILIPIVSVVALFTFLAVVGWAEERRKEREAAYRAEVLKKLADQPGSDAQSVLALMKEDARAAAARRREGLKLGGLITTAAGVGVTALLLGVVRDEPVWLAGMIPVLIGGAMLAYVGFLAPKQG